MTVSVCWKEEAVVRCGREGCVYIWSEARTWGWRRLKRVDGNGIRLMPRTHDLGAFHIRILWGL